MSIIGGAIIWSTTIFRAAPIDVTPPGIVCDPGEIWDPETKDCVATAIDWTTRCDANGEGKIVLGFKNMENLTLDEYEQVTVRTYRMELDGTESYVNSTNLTLGTNPTEIYTHKCGHNYKSYFVANDTNSTSGYLEYSVTTGGPSTMIFKGAKQRGLQFRLWDADKKSWVYGNNETTAGGWQASGVVFHNTTENGTLSLVGRDVALGETVSYALEFSTNGTLSSASRFTDQELMVMVNTNETLEWNKPTFNVGGAYMLDIGTPPGRLGSTGYDYGQTIWIDSLHTQPLIVNYGVRILNIGLLSPGANPTDDVTVAFATKGHYQHTLDIGMGEGYMKDDSAQTYVYTIETATMIFD